MQTEKRCSKCKQPKQVSEFRKDKSRKDGLYGHCKACEFPTKRKYRQSDRGKASHEARKARHYVHNPNYKKAISAVNNAVRDGKLSRLNTLLCNYCPNPAKQYHHYLGYETEHWLDVLPTCIKCHKKIHKEDKSVSILLRSKRMSEFTKEIRELIKTPDDEKGWTKLTGYTIWLEVKLQRACDRLDASEARVTDLVKACREFCQEFCDYGRITHPKNHDWRHSQEYKEEIINKFEAAIKKAGEI